MTNRIVNAGRTNQLANDNTFSTVNYKGSGLCHQRKITHEDLVFTDFFFLLVVQANRNSQRRRISCISLFTLFNRIFHIVLAELKVYKFKAQGTAVVSNRRDIIKDFH